MRIRYERGVDNPFTQACCTPWSTDPNKACFIAGKVYICVALAGFLMLGSLELPKQEYASHLSQVALEYAELQDDTSQENRSFLDMHFGKIHSGDRISNLVFFISCPIPLNYKPNLSWCCPTGAGDMLHKDKHLSLCLFFSGPSTPSDWLITIVEPLN